MNDGGPQLDPHLRELAEAYGLVLEHWDWQGRQVEVDAWAVRAVLAALGVDASTPEATRAALTDRREQPWRRMLPPTVVAEQGSVIQVPVHVVHGDPVDVWVELENGERRDDVVPQDVWVEPQTVDGVLTGRATVALPSDLPLGWHLLHARSGERSCTSTLISVPRVLDPASAPPGSRGWGLMAQLYQLRSTTSWGTGDLGDLAGLALWSAESLGCDFVLVNPLHAAEPVPPLTSSPYLPSTRRFAHPIYLRVADIHELDALPTAERATVAALGDTVRVRPDEAELLDRDAAWTAKRAALELIYQVPLSPSRQEDFDAFRRREGAALPAFAQWCALAETYGSDVTAWPEDLNTVDGPGVATATGPGTKLADLVGFYEWLQWQLDQQLEAVQASARAAGMRIGVIHDLAVGVHPEAADAWTLAEVLVRGCSVGAPPDPFNQLGQNWSQPPWNPDALAEAGYGPFRDMVRATLRHSGGLRIDHVIGLFRSWWIPNGFGAAAGVYVRQDHATLVGIVLLEAMRAGALVIGEDLGVVEPWVRDYLAERGVLGTSISWFEKGWSGEPLDPAHWREACMGTLGTHDLPPTAGYLRGEHLRVRDELGLLTRPREEEQAVDEADRSAVISALHEAGLLPSSVSLGSLQDDDAALEQTLVALHAWLARTPCRLIGVTLADLVGDRQAVNQPGTDQEYPNWRVPLTNREGRGVLLEELVTSDVDALPARVAAALETPTDPGV